MIISSTALQSTIFLSTMSSLAQQLQNIKHGQRALGVLPNQQQPTLILDRHTATSTSSDLIFTMAVVSYAKLVKQHAAIKFEGESIMASENRDINRNTFNKEANRQLSQRLIKFLLKISPFFLSEDCQKVIEYLLHNYKINIFQAEALSIIYLQYWNTAIYQKLIQNIPEKIIQIKLPFLAKLNSKEPHNITYIVKSVSYSHYLMSSLLLYTLEYVKSEGEVNLSMDIEVNLGEDFEENEQKLVRCDPRRFLLQLFTQFMNRKMIACYKYILEFCGRAITPNRVASSQTCSMVMVLAARLFVQESITQELLQAIIAKLIKNASKKEGFNFKSLFDFIVIIWQRKPSSINSATLEFLEKNTTFHGYLMKFKCSLWMVLIHLLQNWIEGRFYINLVKAIGNRVKRDQFYRLYNQQYSAKLFELYQTCLLSNSKQQAEEIVDFFKSCFLYETASFYNGKKVIIKDLKESIIGMFTKDQLKISKSWQFVFNMNKIQKSFPEQKVTEQKPFIEEHQQDQQSENIDEQASLTKSSLLTHLQRKDSNIKKIDYKIQRVKQASRQLIEEYYSEETIKISQQQKNQIIQQNIELYNLQRLTVDLSNEDFISPIKYLAQFYDLESSQSSLSLLITKIQLFDDVLYRELMRLSLNHIAKALNVNYKNIIYFLNTFYKKIISKYTDGENKVELIKLSQVLLKVSEGTIGKVGTKRGKYQKLLHNHGKLIADLIIGIKWKKVVTKQLTNDEKNILDHYLRILKVFGLENLYLLNIGIVEILTRKQIDHSHIRYFINKILLGSIRSSDIDFYELGMSLAKTVVFLSQLGSIIKLSLETLDVSLTSGIAKNIIVEFFGLVKDKFKRVIIKKLLMFIRNIFQNTYIIESFKSHLVEQPKSNLKSLLSLFTEIYKIIGLISSEDGKVVEFKETIMDRITNIFPLNLRLVLFEPLMPNQHLYRYLGDQLEQHVPERSQFAELQQVMNIVPDEVTFEWVKFVRECLKRGYLVGENLVKGVFSKLNLKQNVTPFAEFVSQIASYQAEILFEYLPVCIQVFQKHCENPSDFTLALSAKLIQNLGEMVDPYLNTLILTSLSIQNQFTEPFIAQVTSHLAPSTLIRIVKENWKTVQNLNNFSLFFKAVVIKGVGDALNKTLLSFMNRTLTSYLQEQENPRQILHLQSEILLQISLKMNESQLRKTIIDLVRWSQNKSQIQDQLPFNYRKLAVAQVYCLLSQNLQSLFVPFYGYTFESIIKDFQSINAAYDVKDRESKNNNLKRKREVNKQSNQNLTELYLRITLKSLQLLFVGDLEHEFLDSVKIEALGDPLCQLILLSQNDAFLGVVSEQLTSCLVSLHSCVVDDYQMKNLNYKILVLLKRKNPKIHRVVFELIDRLMDKLQDRFLMLVGDLAPFLLEWASSREQGIAKTVRKIIGKIEELSGEQISAYAK